MTVYALILGSWSLQALLVVGASAACEGLRTANGGRRVFVTTRVIPRITGSAPPVDTLVADAGTPHAFGIPLTGPTQRSSIVADRRVVVFIAPAVTRRVAFTAAATVTCVLAARPILTLGVGIAWPAGERIAIADRGGQPLVAARVIRRRTGPTSPVDALLETPRSNQALAVVGAGAAHLQIGITDRGFGCLVAVGVVLRTAGRASTLDALIHAAGATRALGVADDVVRIVALAAIERCGIADG